MLCAARMQAQTPLSEKSAIELAFKNSPLLQAAVLEVQQKKQLKKSAFSPDDPEVIMESPTGEFMTLGVSQSFEFPTVYVKNSQLAKQEVLLAEKNQAVTAAEVSQLVATSYLALQYYTRIMLERARQDSLQLMILNSAEKQFAAGQIDFIASTMASVRHGEIQNELALAISDASLAMHRLKLYTGITDSIVPDPLIRSIEHTEIANPLADSVSSPAPLLQYQAQAVSVARKNLQLEKHKILPGISFGYMNQGAADTQFPMRLRGGISIPLWFWKYQASIQAAKTEVKIEGEKLKAQQQNVSIQIHELSGNVTKYSASLFYFETRGLKNARDLVSASGRMFQAGQTDYVSYMRSLAEAGNIEIRYLETLRNYNQAIIDLKYLNGQ